MPRPPHVNATYFPRPRFPFAAFHRARSAAFIARVRPITGPSNSAVALASPATSNFSHCFLAFFFIAPFYAITQIPLHPQRDGVAGEGQQLFPCFNDETCAETPSQPFALYRRPRLYDRLSSPAAVHT